MLAAAGIVIAVEEGAGLGDGEARALPFGPELDGRQADRDLPVVDMHLVGVDDALAGNDVPIEGVEGADGATAPFADRLLAPADAEIHRPLEGSPGGGIAAEPARFALLGRPGGPDATGRRVVGAVDDEGRMGDVSFDCLRHVGSLSPQLTIQGIPNRSVTIPKRFAQKVSARGIWISPPSASPAKMRSALSRSSV